ncbi:MAG: DNA mismatch repair protein MutS [Synergistetes bacterium]|nr:DNA mismatch repair protein MutS [Synergistota bacterium]MCX8128236.1 DNA mismatch repair protein MutS [Synergistota bacterium]MDW8192683.1 DNA mismatch repair protein MutS [Synergistota bacterium]
MIDKEELTPALKQYMEIKEKYRDAIVFFRMGDFYEMFYEDAYIAARELGLTLTSRDREKKVPLAGVPYHSASIYLRKLVKKGYKVVICEQVGESENKKIVKREVVRIVTPGTIESEEGEANYIAAVFPCSNIFGLSYADLIDGDFYLMEVDEKDFLSEIERLSPSELLLPENFDIEAVSGNIPRTFLPKSDFDWRSAENVLKKHFGVKSLEVFGCKDKHSGIAAAGALLSYLQRTQLVDLKHITQIKVQHPKDFVVLDYTTQKNLELIQGLHGDEEATLFGVLNKTVTPMGRRMLKLWILRPLRSKEKIKERLNRVEYFYNDFNSLRKIRENLSGIYDIDRILGRLGLKTFSAKDLAMLRDSLSRLPEILKLLENIPLFEKLLEPIFESLDVFEILDEVLVDLPPHSINDEDFIRIGYDEELDELKNLLMEGRQWIVSFEERERKRTGIKSLKVGYNKVFGYYIEVTKANVNMVPSDYERKQTLVQAERFITRELKEYEERILTAEERIMEITSKIKEELREKILRRADSLKKLSDAIAEIDVLSSLAFVALKNGYVKPEIIDSNVITIKDGRHPVVECFVGRERFIPNDVYLDQSKCRIIILTGPNMAGKSTYLRQVAHIVIMAQMGSFVPAKLAKIGLVDRIFTRIGAMDDISRGESTFMIEMSETANILRNATPKSLVILDEVGRGTSTYDGLSIAWAVIEYLYNFVGAKVLFATHYHELTELERYLPALKNYHMAVDDKGEGLTFLYKVRSGKMNKSYGIEVAKIAGLPSEVVRRANEILRKLEKKEETFYPPKQLSLFVS